MADRSDTLVYPVARVGIVGGGQLGRMLAMAAKQLGCVVTILDPAENSPAGQVADAQVVGSLHDEAKIRELAAVSDVLTYEIEDIGVDALASLQREGFNAIFPSPNTLGQIQDKLTQKQALEKAGIPTAPFAPVEGALEGEVLTAFSEFPVVQKARRGGYDGRGVVVIKSLADLEDALPVPSYIEQFIPAEKELAVVVARTEQGETASYPVVEMGFREDENVLDLLLAPARIDDDIARHAVALAEQTVAALEGVGVFGVEFFLTQTGELLVNEVAPRVHNSGHHTIEACYTSQFEQHIRAVVGLPLGSTFQHSYAAMLNVLGMPEARGTPSIDGLAAALAQPGVSVHVYGKQSVRPYRKMGHVTVVAESLEAAEKTAEEVRARLRLRGSDS